MIMPDLATLLGFLATDADVEPRRLRALLAGAVHDSFNALTVDGDTMKYDWTSTNAEGDPLTSSGELHRQAAGGARKR